MYIPQRSRRNSDKATAYAELESLLLKVNQRDCIILMGDFNSKLPRDKDGKVGHWSIHKRSDSGGDILLDLMTKVPLRCVSIYFQPRRNRNNATFMNKQQDKAPSQIDYILVSKRWANKKVQNKMGISNSGIWAQI